MIESISPLASQLIETPADAYAALVVRSNTPSVATEKLKQVTPQQLLTKPITSADDARALLAGLWLWHDQLDESHRISQALETPTGSFWHAIMHRREGDFSNAKYWYARCRRHPALLVLEENAKSTLQETVSTPVVDRICRSGWNSDTFVDLIASMDGHPTDPMHDVAIQLQRMEWTALFECCARAAIGT